MSTRKTESARRTAQGVFQAWEDRKTLVKQEMDAERTAADAKTIRLKALRLEKEALDAEAARIEAQNAPPAAPKKRTIRRVTAA
jgi:hypothetical protein